MDLLKYDNFIFDYDGTIINSMPFWIRCPSEFVKFKGLEPKPGLDERAPFFESLEAAEVIKNEYNFNLTTLELFEEMKKWVYDEYKYVPLKNKSIDLIKFLHKNNKKLFILSSSVNELIKPSTTYQNIDNYFIDIFSASSNKLSKEDGEAFIHFFEKYNLNKENTLVLDDSPKVINILKELNINSISIKEDFYKEYEQELKNNSLGYYSLEDLYNFIK